jgi:TetR/AcrR family transcriptional regulator, transcriptional repressor of bet genes
MRRPRPRATFERQLPQARREAFIEATIHCLMRYGHEGLSIRRIAAQAGSSIGLINHHFPNKTALVAEAYRRFHTRLVRGLEQAVEDAPDDPRARLRVFFEANFSPPHLDRDVLAAWVVFWGLYRHSKAIQRAHRDTYQAYVDLVRGMLEALQRASGRFRMSVRLAAIGLTAMLDGLWLEWCLDPETFRPAEAVGLCEGWVDALSGK